MVLMGSIGEMKLGLNVHIAFVIEYNGINCICDIT